MNKLFARIYIPDATYDRPNEPREWEIRSEEFRRTLEREFEASFSKSNLDGGADWPAFVTNIITSPYILVAGTLYVFFKGKEVKENLEAWIQLGKSAKRFFERNPRFDRQSAALIALYEIELQAGAVPDSIRLIAYQPKSFFLGETQTTPIEGVISDDSEPMGLGRIDAHLFLIDVDGTWFRAEVTHEKVSIILVSNIAE